MRDLVRFIRRMIPQDMPAPPLGRWNTDYCEKKRNQKVDLSNEDHCGPCGQYALAKQEEMPKDKTESQIEKLK